jgi:hypothetical protein
MREIANCKLQIANCKLNIKPRPSLVAIVKPRPLVAPYVFSRALAAAVGWHGRASVAMALGKLWATWPRKRGHGTWIAAIIISLFLFAAGCTHKTENGQQSSKQEKNPAYSAVERGPVKVTAEIQPAKAQLSDEPVLTLTIDYEKGVEIEKPPFGASVGGFLVRDFNEPLGKTRNGREIIQQVYTLEPMRTGKLLIDPISVTFTDLRPNGDEKTHTIQTEALTVEITSMVGNSVPSLADLHPAAGPVDIPTYGSILGWSITIIFISLAIIGWLTRRHFKRKQVAVAVVLSPEEMAQIELDKLSRSRLVETDVVQFYVELTAVVRRYIERTTGIRAPEQTTEEFLREISQANTFNRDTNERLRNFLESADLVKFAAFKPRREDVEESFSRAKIFIGQKPQEPAQQPLEAAV